MKKLVLIFIALCVAGMLFLFYFPSRQYQATPPTIQIPVMSIEMQGTVLNNAIIHTKPDDTSDEETRISEGSVVRILGISVDLKWYLIEYQDLEGQFLQAWIAEDSIAFPSSNKKVNVPVNSGYIEPNNIILTAIPEKPDMTETPTWINPDLESTETTSPVVYTGTNITVTPGDPEEYQKGEAGETVPIDELPGHQGGNKGGLMDESGLVLITYQNQDIEWVPGETLSLEFPNESFHINWNAQLPAQNGPPSPFNPFGSSGFLALSQTSMPVYPKITEPPFLSSKIPQVITLTLTSIRTPYLTRTPTKLPSTITLTLTPTKTPYPTRTPTKPKTATNTLSIFIKPTTTSKYISPTPIPKTTSTNPPIVPTSTFSIFKSTPTPKPIFSPTKY